MSTVLFQRPETGAREDEIRALSLKLDRVTAAVEALDRRREEIEDLVTDLMPAFNGALSMAMRRLDALEKSGALDVARSAGESLEAAAATVDPADLAALAGQAGAGLRTLRALTAPDLLALTERSLDTLRDARKGRPRTFRQLFRAAREPRVRRGLGALMGILRVLGEGVSRAEFAPAAPPARVGPPRSAARPARRPTTPPASGPATCPAPAASAAGAAAETRSLGGEQVAVDGEGFLVDRNAWTPAVAEALAREAGVGALTDEHWRVVEFCREDAGESGAAPGMRRITSQLGVPARDLYRLFPGGPGILAARIAGLGKPKSCV
jgi:TusE/DsrC/DsvC family sulfur relay protein